MKKALFVLVFLYGTSSVFAGSCTNLTETLSRYQETPAVLSLQKFLAEKGYLKNPPNGYFGAGTFSAVKAYQKSIGLEQAGKVGPATRAAIKKETCGTQAGIPSTTTTQSSVSSGSVSVVKPVPQVPLTPSALRNAKRKADAEMLLKTLYRYFVESRGVQIVASGTPSEMCVNTTPLEVSVASSSGGDVVITKDSPCLNFVDISYLVPHYTLSIPRDPSIATTSMLIGYNITRSQYNDITIEAKKPEDGAMIQVTCNFNSFCSTVRYITQPIYKNPEIIALNRNVFIRDATPKVPIVINGNNFTATNTIKLSSSYTGREYTIGVFPADSSTVGATSTTITISNDSLNGLFPCGNGCVDKIPLGEYMLSVTNQGGTSGGIRLALRGFTSSTMSTQVNGSVIPTSKNVKVATIALSSSIPVKLKSLTLTSTTTSKNLPGKISNFVLKDPTDGTTYAGGSGTFTFPNITMFENQSKIYDVYIDTVEVLNDDAGFITYGGKLLITDTFSSVDMEVPIKEFSFTVSH